MAAPKTFFFSYSRADSDFALRLADDLRANGANIWVDQLDIVAGEKWDRAVEAALHGSDGVIVILSPNSVASDNVMDEVSWALGRGRQVVPVLSAQCDIPFRLNRLQFADFTSNYDAGFRQLKRALGVAEPAPEAAAVTIAEAAGPESAAGQPEGVSKPPSTERTAAASRPLLPPSSDSVGSGPGAATAANGTKPSGDGWRTARVLLGAGGAVAAAVLIGIFVYSRVQMETPAQQPERADAYKPADESPKPAPAPAQQQEEQPAPQKHDPPTQKALPPAAGAEGRKIEIGETFRDCPECPEMVVVPGGTFTIGSPPGESERDPDEGPQMRVTIAGPFAVGKYEVTFEEWDACVAAGGCGGHRPKDPWGRARQPVVNVNWGEAQAYVSWLSKRTGKPYRLLTEPEWEYAARARTTTRYPWGDQPGKNRANFDGSGSQWSNKQTAPVGSFAPNGFGLHDMIGNVWEWVQDCYADKYGEGIRSGSAFEKPNCRSRVRRGGSWSYDPRIARAANRSGNGPASRSVSLGFRVCRGAPIE